MMETNAEYGLDQAIESALIAGDLSKLTPAQRVTYYNQVCKSLGLNPLTRPFDYIILNGRLTLYAKKDAADQLRKIHKISIEKPDIQITDDLILVTVIGHTLDGRTDAEIGVVRKDDMRGDLANALMKAVTKAKRRLTLSLCGLGWLDETEIDTIPEVKPVIEPAMELPEPRPESQEVKPAKPTRPMNPNQLKNAIYTAARKNNLGEFQEKDRQSVAATLEYIFLSEAKRHDFILWLTDGETDSLKSVDEKLILSLKRWLKPTYDKNATAYIPTDEFAVREAHAAWEEFARSKGQLDLGMVDGPERGG